MDALLSEKKFSEISVTDLARRAQVGRQTFYRHFDSIGAMLDLRLTTKLSEQMKWAVETARDPSYQDWFYQMNLFAFEQLAMQPHVARAILSGEAGRNALNSIQEQIAAIHDTFEGAPQNAAPPELQNFLSAFRAGAIVGISLKWIETDCKPEAPVMARLVTELLADDRMAEIGFSKT